MRIAVTGSIGSGKSVLLECAKERADVFALSADKLNAKLFSDIVYMQLLESVFPEAFVSGRFDKSVLSGIVFADAGRRAALNALSHPRITALAEEEIAAAEKDGKHIVFEVPLLAESGMRDMFDRVIYVESDKKTQTERIMSRDGISEAAAEARLAAASKADRDLADILVPNFSGIDEFKALCRIIFEKLFA